MQKFVQQWLENLWYQNHTPNFCLKILSHAFTKIVNGRQFLYQNNLFKQVHLPVPVVIVGNLTIGGTGKSPLVVYLAALLSNAGYKPGIISRGYGGKASRLPQRVFATSDPEQVGDEAVMLALKTHCPVAVGSKRAAAAALLLSETDCNVLISDDGLQHYALQRDIEIVVIDGERRFGNGYCLPAGPLRETVERLNSVDLVVVNGAPLVATEFAMTILSAFAINCQSAEQRLLTTFRGQPIHTLAGIGNPQRFFNLLNNMGISHTPTVFPDHYQYQASDISFKDDLPVFMTEKDAVKCRAFATQQHWFVPIKAELGPIFDQQLLQLLREKQHGS